MPFKAAHDETEPRLVAVWRLPELVPSDVVFLTGAGISADAPTNGPVGPELTERALSFAFLPEALPEIQTAYEVLGLPDGRMPRLEAILEIAARVHGVRVLEHVLSDLAHAGPNDVHRFFGHHVLAGGTHVTANFDTLIERATPGARLLHFHGSIGAGNAGFEMLGARLSRIERGFEARMQARLERVLLPPESRTLIVAGYSGLDYFDMDPFIASQSDRLVEAFQRVIWVAHDPSASPREVVEVSLEGPPMLRAFAGAGVNCTVVSALTSSVLDALAVQWGASLIGPQHRDGVSWIAPCRLSIEDRAEATRRLFLHMGLYRSHASLLTRHAYLAEQVTQGERAEIAWQEGRHAAARRHWANHYAGSGDALLARRLERVAACLWDHGSYLRAYITVMRAVRIARGSGDVEIHAITIETQARILIHMGRLYDLRWFASQAKRQRLADRLENLVSANTFGSNLRPRLLDAAELLRHDPEHLGAGAPTMSAPTAWSESYAQYESLSGVTDYRRGEMRRAVATGVARMTREWLDDYRCAAEFLGKRAAVSTMPNLPGAARCFKWWEGLGLLAKAPATPWHKTRMIGVFIARRARVAARTRTP